MTSAHKQIGKLFHQTSDVYADRIITVVGIDDKPPYTLGAIGLKVYPIWNDPYSGLPTNNNSSIPLTAIEHSNLRCITAEEAQEFFTRQLAPIEVKPLQIYTTPNRGTYLALAVDKQTVYGIEIAAAGELVRKMSTNQVMAVRSASVLNSKFMGNVYLEPIK